MIIPHRYREALEVGLNHYLATGECPVLDRHFEIETLHRDGRETTGRAVERLHRAVRRAGVPGLPARHLRHRAPDGPRIDQPRRVRPAFGGRLAALGKAHEILIAATWERASLRTLADELLGSYAWGIGAQMTFVGDPVSLLPRQMLSASMILHEFLTNDQVRRAGAAGGPGRARLAPRRRHAGAARAETGVPGVIAPLRKGFGSKMIALSVGHELGGTGDMNWCPDGLGFTPSFPISAMEAA